MHAVNVLGNAHRRMFYPKIHEYRSTRCFLFLFGRISYIIPANAMFFKAYLAGVINETILCY
jgi:hypothetical protein